MGTDNLFHKHKAKNKKQLTRHGKRREPYAKVLIVCEGKKTEPLYFEDIKSYYKLNSVNVQIDGTCGSDPVSIYNYGKQLYREEANKGDPFDKVYCVFDQDTHSNYELAMHNIHTAKPAKTYIAINSVPCFEYWLLLHFECTTKPFKPTAKNSACKQVEKCLKQYFPEYTKGQGNIFTKLIDLLDAAHRNADKIRRFAEENATNNPTTRVHELVAFLQDIKSPPR